MRVEFKDFHGLESYLKLKGYKKYDNQKYKNEDFALWKSFDVSYDIDGQKKVGYQIGLLFYDTSKYDIPDNTHYGIQFEFVSGDKIEFDRADFTISDDINIYRFEEICQKLYEFLRDTPRYPPGINLNGDR
jgi:hypothetical protein